MYGPDPDPDIQPTITREPDLRAALHARLDAWLDEEQKRATGSMERDAPHYDGASFVVRLRSDGEMSDDEPPVPYLRASVEAHRGDEYEGTLARPVKGG